MEERSTVIAAVVMVSGMVDARVAEVELAAGERVQAWTYNGSIPGPLIRARKGNRRNVFGREGNHVPVSRGVSRSQSPKPEA